MAKRKTNAGPESFSDQLRRIIADSGRSRYSICKAAGVDPGQLHRFVNDRPGGRLTNDTIDKLFAALRLRLVVQDPEQ